MSLGVDSILERDDDIRARASKVQFSVPKYKGKLIVLEGVDGAGKSTSLEFIYEFLKCKGITAHKIDMLSPEFRKLSSHRLYADDHTRALTGEIDQTAIAISAMGDRLQRFRSTFHEKLKEGEWLVCDRYIFTPLSEALALGIKDNEFNVLLQIAALFPKPDLGFVAKVDAETAIQRIRSRPDESDKKLDIRFYKRAINAFVENGKANDFVELDTSLGFQAVEDIVQHYLEKLLKGDQ
ncbi:hypothetical protein JNUCC31_17935 [Paenibacillus sp. JNUCC31]|uniref:dTMP kinase n=1 Tax=Paenibacillus sp. JNUCC-31 TaxID=2777983 RepID=UPI001784BF1E|nr:hypothetical protein [Paenibacillus sp. JNUCC-31]QOS76722.1 hypothetical protein JNUCC31_17935 [Paenibacillus sp. JNUCC-31]